MSKLKDIVEILDAKRIPLSSKERIATEKIYPYYGAQGIIDYIDKYIFDGNYILVAEDGNNLKSLKNSIATWASGKFWVNNHAHILGEKNGFNLKYVYYYLNSIDLRGIITGSAQPKLSQDNLANLDIALPNINIQNKIALILSSIDDKIELNNKINSELEAMAKTIYDYWFLQFEFPNEEGKPYKSSGGKMVWNEELKREIPEGWEVTQIGNTDVYISDFTANGSFAGLRKNVQYNVGEKYALLIRPIDFNNNFNNPNDAVYINQHAYEYLSKSKLIGDEIIICNVGAVGEIYRCPEFNIPMTLGPNGIIVNYPKYNNFLSLYFKSNIGQQCIKSISSGSIQLKFNKTNFRQIRLYFPPNKIINNFNKIYEPIYNKQKNIWKESRKLISLRDFLLPLLMNGQVGFKD